MSDTPEALAPAEDREHRAASASILRGSASSFVAQLANNAGAFLAVLVIARELDRDGRGAIAFVTVVSMLVAKVAKLGIPEATIVLAARRPADRGRIVATLLAFALTVPVAFAIVTVAVLWLVPGAKPDLVTHGAVVAIGLAIVGSGVVDSFYGFLLGCQRYRAIPLMAVNSWLYAGLVCAAALLGHLDVTTAALAFGASSLFGGVLLFAAAARGSRPEHVDRALAREALHFGVRAWPGGFATQVNFRLDQLLLAYLAGEAVLGVYAVAVNVSELLLYLPNAAATALTPAIAAASPLVQRAAAVRAFRTLIVVATATVVPAALIGPVLIPVVFGERFEASVVPFLCLLVGTFGWGAVTVFTNALLATQRPGRSAVGIGTSLVVGIALDLLLIPPFGATGAAVAASAAFMTGAVVTIATYWVQTRFPLRDLVPRAEDVTALYRIAGRVGRRLGRATT